MIHLGNYATTLHDATWDALICDPPYGERTHRGNDGQRAMLNPIEYQHFTPADVHTLVEFTAPRTRGWMACMTSHDLIPVYEEAYAAAGRYAFAPVPILQDRYRQGGDGPASCAIYLMVSRPKTRQYQQWASLPGYYLAELAKDGYVGGKPLSLMTALVLHYSRPGDVVCDPCAGYGTTLVAAVGCARIPLGSEILPGTHAIAARRLAEAPPPPPVLPPMPRVQTALL